MSLVGRASIMALVAALAVLLYLVAEGGHTYIVKAEFRDADGLRKNYNVDIGAVQAGTIDSVTVTRHNTALVTMSLNHGSFPVGAGASAQVRPVNLLGEKYVDLNPGNLRRPQPSGTVIPVSRTGTAVDLDQILDMLDPSTTARLRILINEAGVALAGQGANFNALLSAAPGSMGQLGTLISSFSRDNAALRSLITQGDEVSSAADSRQVDLQHLIDTAEQALQVVASRRVQLASTIGAAQPGVSALRSTLRQLQDVAGELRPTAVEIRDTAPYLANTLALLPGFAADADPALREAKAVAPAIDRLGITGTPTVQRLAPALADLNRFSTSLAPTTKTLAGGGAAQDLLRFVNNWATLTEPSDGLGHLFRVRLTLDPSTLGLPKQSLERTAKAAARSVRRRVAEHPAAACVSAQPSNCSVGKSAPAPASAQSSDSLGRVLGLIGAAGSRTLQAAEGVVSKVTASPSGGSPGGSSGAPPASVQKLSGLLRYLFGS